MWKQALMQAGRDAILAVFGYIGLFRVVDSDVDGLALYVSSVALGLALGSLRFYRMTRPKSS